MAKPTKPYPDFPLTPRADGRWQKKVGGKTAYFRGTAAEAMEQYREMVEGKAPPGGRVKDLANELLSDKLRLVENRELSPTTFAGWKSGCDAIVKHMGPMRDLATIGPSDFADLRASLADGRGLVSLGNLILSVRGVFKYAYDAGLIDRPVRFHPSFKPPTKGAVRRERKQQGDVSRMASPEECRRLIEYADGTFRAIVLLGLNAAYGNTDVATLPRSALDLESGWADYPRPKTEEPRRAWLWPETIAAIRWVDRRRRPPRDPADANLAFLTRQQGRWAGSRVNASGTVSNYGHVSRRFAQLAETAGVARPGLTFYALRRTWRTAADELRDDPAADLVMGHVTPGMGAIYRQRIGDERVRAVCEHVRKWVGL